VADGINAVRTLFPNMWFDRDKCADGVQALRYYRYDIVLAQSPPRCRFKCVGRAQVLRGRDAGSAAFDLPDPAASAADVSEQAVSIRMDAAIAEQCRVRR
jgi:hypothetical protein